VKLILTIIMSCNCCVGAFIPKPCGRIRDYRLFVKNYIERSAKEGIDQSRLKIHLFSLRWPDEKDPRAFSKIVRDTWRWKDTVLGDGRDFFVPRPKTLKALQYYIQSSFATALLESPASIQVDSISRTVLQECVVLSNCARFEILVVTDSPSILSFIAHSIVSQVQAFQSRPFKSVQLPLDWPGTIAKDTRLEDSKHGSLVADLTKTQHWVHLQGTEEVSNHLCSVAAGMAPRPSRPDRPVLFQPFSSRDAHILLQLKRTFDNVAQEAPRLSLLLRYALQAGKAVRNPDKVPELMELRQYGTGNSKFDSKPPQDVVERITQVRDDQTGLLKDY
jgi:hypothetical protein